jgi:hypothetical protein
MSSEWLNSYGVYVKYKEWIQWFVQQHNFKYAQLNTVLKPTGPSSRQAKNT